MTDPLATLADRMVGSRTIGFIGAGTSVRLGLPLWNDLIQALYRMAKEYDDTVPEPGTSLDYRWLAEIYGEVIRSHSSLQEALESIFADHRRHHPSLATEPERLHELIARLPFKHFITTNYDRFIEDACDRMFETIKGHRPMAGERCLTRDGRVSDSFSDFLGAFSQDTHRSVLHLHGTLQGENLTLSMAEYSEQYLQDAMLLRMFSIFATSTVVFIGASLQDADLMELVRRSTFHTGSRQRHYAFITDDRRYEAGMLRRNYGIEPIFYSAGPDGQHEELDRSLERLLELVEPRRDRPAASAMGNARPVQVRHGDDFEDVVNLVKDEVRRVRRGAAKMSGVSETASSRILRRIASDYRELPVSYRFHHVVWISPGRIGLFPGVSRSRGVLNSIVGEVVYALGRHRLTGTSDPMASIRSVRRIVGGSRWNDAEPILFVIDGFDDLIRQSQEDPKIFDELFSFLPTESVALYCRCSVDKAPSAEASRVDPIAESFVRGDTAQDEPRWAKPESQAEIASLLDDYDDPHFDNTSATVLAALCLVATPIAAVELALMLNLTQRDLAGTLRDLYERGLIEGAVDNTANIAGTESPHDPETEDGRSGSLGVLNPIRRAVLEDPDFRTELASVASTLLRWAETTVEGLSNWGEDNAQLDQLTRHLPNVLTVFEACCWLSALDANGLGSDAVDRHLWLGTDLAYILYNVGRWAEAEQLLEYLGERAKGRIPGTEIEDAPKPAELHTFLREVLILQSRYREHAGTSSEDFASALAKAEEAFSNAEWRVAEGDEEYEPGDNTYAPNRLTLARQRARAQIARGLALLKTGRVDDAEAQLRRILRDREFDGRADGHDGTREMREKQRESRLIVADAARALGGVRMTQLENESLDQPALEQVFDELDTGRDVVSVLNNRRARGHNALRRGDILFRLRNTIAARRYYARSVLIAREFRDRFLEAGAILGLANCDADPRLAERSLHIYRDLGLDEREAFARDCVFRLRHEAEAGVLPAYPRVIVVVGIPGTGKSIVTRTAGSLLAEWRYEPYTRREELIDSIRQGQDIDLSEVMTSIIEPMEREIEAAERRVVGIVKIPTGRLGELFEPWMKDRELLRKLLCIRMEVTPELARARNAQRRSGQLLDATLEKMTEDHRSQDPRASLGYSTWESAFQANNGTIVSVDSATSILDLESRIRNALALSYLPYDQLTSLEESEGSTG